MTVSSPRALDIHLWSGEDGESARFRDPAGNVIGLYQEPGRPAPSGA